jgi:minor extracellular serine protease Vpr
LEGFSLKLFCSCTFVLCCAFAAHAQTPVVSDGGVANAASFERGAGVAPGSMVAIFGTGLATNLVRSDSVPLSLTISDVSVTFNGVPAPLQSVSENMIMAQVPWTVVADPAVAGPATVVVNAPGIQSPAVTIPIIPVAPAIYRIHPWTPQAMALNPDGTLAAAMGAIEGFQSHPANAGDAIVVYANGLGAVTPSAATGANSQDTTRVTVATPTVLIQGLVAQVTFAGLSPKVPGLNLLNVVVPAGIASSDAAPIQIQVGGITTTPQITIAVRAPQ